ncbi:hypothetical protein ACF0H5_011057 [Mactra antiquata]
MGISYPIQYGVVTTIIWTLVHITNAGEYCNKNGNYEYCSGYCCESGSSECCTENWGWIAGAVIGGIIVVAILATIVFFICTKMNTKKVRTVNVQNNPRVVTHTQPHLHNQGRNMYSTNMYGNNMYPAPSGLPPPPAYSQVPDPNTTYIPPPPPPYPGTPLPPQYNNLQPTTTPRNNYTTLGNTTSDPVYPPPPPVS